MRYSPTTAASPRTRPAFRILTDIADAEQFVANVNWRDGEACFVLMLDGTLIGACGIDPRDEGAELGYWLGAGYWGHGFMTEAARAVIDYAFGDLRHETLQSGARVSNPASRRVLEKCAFQWTGVRLTRIRAINSAAPIDRFRLDRGLWLSLKAWGRRPPRGVMDHAQGPAACWAAKNGASFATKAGPKCACGFDGRARSISSQPWMRTRALSNAR